MKLHLPKGLRTAVLACFAAFAGIGTTLTTATITGGVFAVSMASQAVAAITVDFTTATSPQIGVSDSTTYIGTGTVGFDGDVGFGYVLTIGAAANEDEGTEAKVADVTFQTAEYSGGKFGSSVVTVNVREGAEIIAGSTMRVDGVSGTEGLNLRGTVTNSGNLVIGTGLEGSAPNVSIQQLSFKGTGATLTQNSGRLLVKGDFTLGESTAPVVTLNGGTFAHGVNNGDTTMTSWTSELDVTMGGVTIDTNRWRQTGGGGDLAWTRDEVGSTLNFNGGVTVTGATKVEGIGTLAATKDITINNGASLTLTNGALTLSNGATIRNNGALTLGGTVTLNTAIVMGTGATVALAEGTKIDVSGMQGTTTDGKKTVYTLFTGEVDVDLAGLGLTADDIIGGDHGSWKIYSDGTIAYELGETITYSTDTTVTWAADGTGEGVFTDGDSVIVSAGTTAATLAGNVRAAELTVKVGATLNIAKADSTLDVGTLTNQGTLKVASNVTVGVYDYGDDTGIGTISVAEGKTLTITDLEYYKDDDTNDAMNLWQVLLAVQEDSAGTVVFAGDVSGWADHTVNDETIVGGFMIDGSVKFNRGGNATNVTIGSGNGRLYVTKDINLSNSQNWTVQGVLTAGGILSLGHTLEDERYNGTLTVAGGTVTANKLHLYTTASKATLNSGRLNIGSEGITVASGKTPAITLAGGTLGATADWTAATAITVTGGVTVDTTKQTVSSIGIASTPAEGAEAATIRLTSGLTATGETSKLTVDGNGKLVLGGTVALSNAIELGANAALELAANTVLDLSAMKPGENNTYTLLTGEGAGSLAFLKDIEGLTILCGAEGNLEWTFSETDGTLSYTSVASSVWAGGDMTWSSTAWTDTEGNTTPYKQGGYVEFTGTDAKASTITLSENVSATHVMVHEGAEVTLKSAEDGSYLLSASGGIELAGELTIQGNVLDTATKLTANGDNASFVMDGTTENYSSALDGYTGKLTLKNTSMSFSANAASALRSLTLGTGGAAAISGDGATAAVKLAGGNLTLSNYHQFKGSVELIGSSAEENVGAIISGATLAALSCDTTGTGSLTLQGGASGGGLLLRGTLGFKGNLTLSQASDNQKVITLDGGKVENVGNVTVESAEFYASAANINNTGILAVTGGKLLLNAGTGVGANVTGLSLTGGTFATKENFTSDKATTLGAVTLGGVDGYTGTITFSGATTFAGTVTNNGTLALTGTLAIDETAAASMAGAGATWSDGATHADNGFLTATYTLVNGGTVTGITETTKVTLGASQLDAKWDADSATLTAAGRGSAYYVNSSSEYTAENSDELKSATSIVINNATLTLTDASVFTEGDSLKAGDPNASFVMKGIEADYTALLTDYTGAVTVTGTGAKLLLSKNLELGSLTVADGAILNLANGSTYNQGGTITLNNGEIKLQWNDLLGTLALLEGGGTVSIGTAGMNAILGATVNGSGPLTLAGEGETLGLKSAVIENDSTVTLKGSILIGRDAASSLLNKGKVTVADGATVELSTASSIANKSALEIATGGKLTANAGTTLANDGDVSVLGTLATSTAITSTGKVTVGNGGLVTLKSGSSLANGGALEIAHGGTLTQEAGASITATDITVGGTLNVTSVIKGADGFKLTIEETTVDTDTVKGQINLTSDALRNWADTDKVTDFVDPATQNGFVATTYTLVSGASNAMISDGAQVHVDGTGYALAKGTDTITFAFTGTDYYVTTGTVDYSTISTASATGVVLNGGTLAIAETDTSIVPVRVAENSTVNLAANASLAASGVTIAVDKTLTLEGAGTYVASTADALAGLASLKDSTTWTGTIDTFSGTGNGSLVLTGQDLNDLGNASSTIHLKGVKGYMAAGEVKTNIKLSNSSWAGLALENVTTDTAYTFSGKVSGDGNLNIESGNTGAVSLTFSGDVSGWTGKLNANKATEVTFSGDTDKAIKVNMAGSAAVTYSGTGAKTISGTNTYTGGTTVAGGKVIATTNDSLGSGLTTVNSGTLELDSAVTELKGGISLADGALLYLNGSKLTGTTAITNNGTVKMADGSSIAGLTSGKLEVEAGASVTSSADMKLASLTNAGTLDLGSYNLEITAACDTCGDVTTTGKVTLGGNSTFGDLTASTLKLGGTLKAAELGSSLTRIELTQKLDGTTTPLTVDSYAGKALTFALTADLLPAGILDPNAAATKTPLLESGSALDADLALVLDVTKQGGKALAANQYQDGVTLYTLMVDGNDIVLMAEFNGTEWKPTGAVAEWSQDSSEEFGGDATTSMPLDANLMFSGGGTENGAGTVSVAGKVTADSVTVEAADTSYTFAGKEGTTAVIDIEQLEVLDGSATFTDVTVGAEDGPLASVEVAAAGSMTVDDGATIYVTKLTDESTSGLTIKDGGEVSVGDGSDIAKLVNDGAFAVTAGTATVDALSGSGSVTVAKDATLAVTAPAADAPTALSIGVLGGEGTLNATGWDVTQTAASTGGHVVAKSLTAATGSTLNSLNVADSLTLNLADLADGKSLLTLTDAVPGATGSTTINVAADDTLLTGAQLGVGEYTLVSLTGGAAGAYTFTGLDQLWTDAAQQEYALAGLYADLKQTADGLVFSVVEDDPRQWQGGDFTTKNDNAVGNTDNWAGHLANNGGQVLDLSQLEDYRALDSVDEVKLTKDTVIDLSNFDNTHMGADGLVINHLTGTADLTLKSTQADLVTLANMGHESGLGDSTYEGKLVVEGMQVNVAGNGEYTLNLADVSLTEASMLVKDGASMTAAAVELKEASFSVQENALVVVDSITGDAASSIGGVITVNGTGTDYSGSYNGATIQLGNDASVKLVAKQGLSITDAPVATFAAGTKSVVLDCTTAPAAVDAIHVSNTDITLVNAGANGVNTLTVMDSNSTMVGGTLTFSVDAGAIGDGTPNVITSGLQLDGTKVVANQLADVKDVTFQLDQTEGLTLFTLVNSGLTVEDLDTENGTFFTGTFFNRYFDASSLTVDTEGNVKADLVTDYYTSELAQTDNGAAGLEMLDKVELVQNPQSGDLADLLDSLAGYKATTDKAAADKLGAAVAGSGAASLGMALAGDVERQLKAIRNRTTTMGVDPAVVNEDMPYFNAWINAEGDHRSLDQDGMMAGYTLSSWGGTVGFDMDVTPELTWGLAVTAMYGDFSAESADVVEGDVDTYYVSAFARATSGAWVHTFVATMGMSQSELTRTVSHANGSYTTQGDADGLSFGLMYEVARTFALNEDASACWQPVFNVTYRHTEVDGYSETGSDAALKVGDQSLDTVTFGLGGRLQAIVGESIYNRTSIFEARALVKLDAGDRESEMDTALLALPGHGSTVKSAEMDAFGVELGAGLTIPMGMESGSIFIDGSVEFRGSYTSANGTLGYRFNF